MDDDKGLYTAEAMPTRGGSYSAWQPEYQGAPNDHCKDGWRTVPMTRSPHGVPGCPFNDGLNSTIGLCSFAQANAIAWMHAAATEAQTGKAPPVRVVEYRVKYDIKCYRAMTPTP